MTSVCLTASSSPQSSGGGELSATLDGGGCNLLPVVVVVAVGDVVTEGVLTSSSRDTVAAFVSPPTEDLDRVSDCSTFGELSDV